jgi:3-oxoacyl-[acyl-carrier protein] reductase
MNDLILVGAALWSAGKETRTMLLEHRTALIWGGGGSVGSAIARTFASEGARVFLAGRTQATLDNVAHDIAADGGSVEAATVDVLDEAAALALADRVAGTAGGLDISFDALSNDDVQGTPLIELPLEQAVRPVEKAVRSRFVTTKAAARHMVARGSGVIGTISGGYREAFPSIGGTVVAWATIEALFRQWACELGPLGVRVVWLRTTGIPETIPDTGDAVDDLNTGFGEGMTRDQIIDDMLKATLLGRLPTLNDVGNVAAFLVSDRAAAMTATFGNITCGQILD